MNAKNDEYVKLHADLQWTIDILERIKDVIDADRISIDDLETISYLVKQGLKVKGNV